MKLSLRTVAGCLLLFGASLVVSGCGKKDGLDGKLTGKVLNKGQPYQGQLSSGRLPPGEEGLATIIFYPITADNQTILVNDNEPMPGGIPASIRADGTFEMIFSKKGLAPGKYRVVIKHMDPRTDADLLKGKFNEKNSKINKQIKVGDEVVIDLGT